MEKQQLIISTCKEDREWMHNHLKSIDHLVALVQEIFTEEPKLLLSPLFRNMIVENTEKVKAQRDRLVSRELFVDNLGQPLSQRG